LWFDKQFDYEPRSCLEKLCLRTEGIELLDLPKWFKNVLSWNFSYLQHQEIPEVSDNSKILVWDFFCPKDKRRIRTLLREHRKRTKKNVFLWNLLQCKSLSHKVPQEFCIEALKKHRSTMEKKPHDLDQDFIEEIKSFVRPWAKETASRYNGITRIPNTHACYEVTRRDGGNRGFYKSRGRISEKVFLREDKDQRFDPIVIHIEGPPGVGKSTFIRKLTNDIGKMFGYYNRTDTYGSFVYSRSAKSDFWDGYSNQLISVIDDFGYEGRGYGQAWGDLAKTSVGELIQICSDVPYQLNMAHLKDKGKCFTSKFLILSSNDGRETLNSIRCADTRALSRRIEPTFLMNSKYSEVFKTFVMDKHYNVSPQAQVGGVRWSNEEVDIDYFLENNRTLRPYVEKSHILKYAINTYLKRQSFWSENNWKQVISHFKEDNLSLDCRLNPPEKPFPCVRACVVVESLKARIITTPEAESYCLKPLQLAMFDALKRWNCFEPCWTPDYNLDVLGKANPDLYYLSGDYSSATDNLNYFASQAVMDVLCEEFKHMPHLVKWIKYEGQKHIVEYGRKTGIPDVVQENGQLMGSLLSFPILTILNSFTICKATGRSMEDVPALFHGDDIAAQLSSEEIGSWKQIASKVGLSLSVGKNYISKDYVSIDSQLFCRVDDTMVRQKTGKFKLIKRERDQSFTCEKAMINGFNRRQIRTYCADQLQQTVRSLDVPVDYGGLGESGSFPDRPITMHEKLVYLSLVESKAKPKRLAGNIYQIEKGTAAVLNLEKGSHHDSDQKDSDRDDEGELLRQTTRLHRRFRKNAGFALFVKQLELPKCRPIPTIKSVITRCADLDLGELRKIQAARLNIYCSDIKSVNKDFSRRQTIQPVGAFSSFARPMRRGLPKMCC
jgi:hypothetical protein